MAGGAGGKIDRRAIENRKPGGDDNKYLINVSSGYETIAAKKRKKRKKDSFLYFPLRLLRFFAAIDVLF